MADPVLLAAEATGPDIVWLDSAVPVGAPPEAGERARWSILAFCDGPFGARFVSESRRVTVSSRPAAARWFGGSAFDETGVDAASAGGASAGGATDDSGTTFDALERLLAATPSFEEPVPGCGFALGWVGYLGYELGRECG